MDAKQAMAVLTDKATHGLMIRTAQNVLLRALVQGEAWHGDLHVTETAGGGLANYTIT